MIDVAARVLLTIPHEFAAQTGQSARTTGVLSLVALILVLVGMGRPPLVSERVWRWICWSAAAEVGLFAWQPSAWLHVLLGLLAPPLLAWGFWLEAKREKSERVRIGYRGRRGSKGDLRGAKFGPNLDVGIDNEGEVDSRGADVE